MILVDERDCGTYCTGSTNERTLPLTGCGRTGSSVEKTVVEGKEVSTQRVYGTHDPVTVELRHFVPFLFLSSLPRPSPNPLCPVSVSLLSGPPRTLDLFPVFRCNLGSGDHFILRLVLVKKGCVCEIWFRDWVFCRPTGYSG